MSFLRSACPDGSPIAINPDKIVHAAPVPAGGALMELLSTGTRIVFKNQSHQDVRVLLDEVIARIDAARSGQTAAVVAPAPVTRGQPQDSRS
ncbi:MAG: hypothetical protein ACT4O2_11170 [Beijerinckiaceae bacterium]